MQELVTFQDAHGHSLSGVLSSPSEAITPLVIMTHGLNSGKMSATHLALEKILLSKNIAVFRFDFFAHGESGGEIEKRSVDEFVENVLAAIVCVKKKGYENIALFGSSFGGVVSVLAAVKTSGLRALALKAPGMGQNSRNMEQYAKDFKEKSWIRAGAKLSLPALIVHGTKDESVEVKFAQELTNAIKGSTLKLYSDVDHRFSQKEDFDKMIDDISVFLIVNVQS